MIKKYTLYIMVAIAATSCATKKSVQIESAELHSTEIREEIEAKSGTFIDTTKIDEKEITVTEIEFFFPDSAVNDGNAISSNIGAVKKIKRTTIKATAEQKGTSIQTAEIKADKFEEKKDSVAQKKNVITITTSNKWKYILYITMLIVFIMGIIYIKRKLF